MKSKRLKVLYLALSGTAIACVANALPASLGVYFLWLVAAVCIYEAGEVLLLQLSDRWWMTLIFAGGILGAILCVLNLVLFGKAGHDFILIFLLASTAFMLVFPRCFDLLRPVRGLFLLGAAIHALVFLWLLVLMAANLPVFAPRREPLPQIATATPEQAEDYEKLMALIPRPDQPATGEALDREKIDDAMKFIWEKDGAKLLDDRNQSVLSLAPELHSVDAELNRLWGFLAGHHPVAGREPLNNRVPAFVTLRNCMLLESLAIRLALEKGEVDAGKQRLLRLLTALNHLMEMRAGLGAGMISIAFLNLAIENVISGSGYLNEPVLPLLNEIAQAQVLIPEVLPAGFLHDSLYWLSLLDDRKLFDPVASAGQMYAITWDEIWNREGLNKLRDAIVGRVLCWPFYNALETRAWATDQYLARLRILTMPDFERRVNETRKLEQETEAELDRATLWNPVNPFGRYARHFYSLGLNRSSIFITSVRAKAAAVEALLRRKWGVEQGHSFVNPLTGKPFVIDASGAIDITEGMDPDLKENVIDVLPKGRSAVKVTL